MQQTNDPNETAHIDAAALQRMIESEVNKRLGSNRLDERGNDVRALAEAQRWYEAFCQVAQQPAYPMVTGQTPWEHLTDWYKDLLAAAMETFLKEARP